MWCAMSVRSPPCVPPIAAHSFPLQPPAEAALSCAPAPMTLSTPKCASSSYRTSTAAPVRTCARERRAPSIHARQRDAALESSTPPRMAQAPSQIRVPPSPPLPSPPRVRARVRAGLDSSGCGSCAARAEQTASSSSLTRRGGVGGEGDPLAHAADLRDESMPERRRLLAHHRHIGAHVLPPRPRRRGRGRHQAPPAPRPEGCVQRLVRLLGREGAARVQGGVVLPAERHEVTRQGEGPGRQGRRQQFGEQVRIACRPEKKQRKRERERARERRERE